MSFSQNPAEVIFTGRALHFDLPQANNYGGEITRYQA